MSEIRSRAITVPLPESQSLEQQSHRLSFLVDQGLYAFIEGENFPALPPEKVALSRFFATHNAMNSLVNARNMAQDPQLQKTLDTMCSELITERDRRFAENLGEREGVIDEEKLRRHTEQVQRPVDRMQLLLQLSSGGFIEEITPNRFPELNGFSQREVIFLQTIAAQSRVERLRHLKTSFKASVGFGREGEDSLSETLDQELVEASRQFDALLVAYLHTEGSSRGSGS